MEHGRVTADGEASEICNLFYEYCNSRIRAQARVADAARISASGEVQIAGIDILDGHGNPVDAIESGGMLRVRVKFVLLHDLEGIEIVIGTHRTDFIYISAATTRDVLPDATLRRGAHEIEYVVPSFPLAAGTYSIRLAYLDRNGRFLFNGESLKTFAVEARRREVMNTLWKTVNVPTELRIDGASYAVPP
jgi:hypothetical protein